MNRHVMTCLRHLLNQRKLHQSLPLFCNKNSAASLANTYKHLSFCQSFVTTRPILATSSPKLSPQEVNKIIRDNENSFVVGKLVEAESSEIWDGPSSTPSQHAIVSFDYNQLPSNNPIEDKVSAAKCLLTTGFFFGMFDGHGGPECSQVICKRLFDYIAAALLPKDELKRIVSQWEAGLRTPLIEVYDDSFIFVPELQAVYDASFLNWCKLLLNSSGECFSMDDTLCKSFVQLDCDIGKEVETHRNTSIFEPLLRVAMSGSVACVAHLDGPHLHIANVGDCGAVLGVNFHSSRDSWLAHRLSEDHNFSNISEVNRVMSEHPESEHNTVIQNQRLLGMLMPFRAFGDFRFKWTKQQQNEYIQPHAGDSFTPTHCYSPPYLIARPEVSYHRLRPHDRFLVLASDGLWEALSPIDVVSLVGEYMRGKSTLQPVKLPKRKVMLGEVERILEQRKSGLKLKPVDTNAATHLIRHAVGGTDLGLDHARLAHSLLLPPEYGRQALKEKCY